MEEQAEKPWQTKIIDILTKNPWFSVLLQSVTFPDGFEKMYYTISFPTPAVGIVVRREHEYLLIRQYRFIVKEFVWAIPSGGVNPDESLEAAAARELEEETGYKATKLRHLLHFYPSYGCSDQKFEVFLAEEPILSGNAFDKNEVISTQWFKREDLISMIMQNEIVDALSVTPLLFVLLQDALHSAQ